MKAETADYLAKARDALATAVLASAERFIDTITRLLPLNGRLSRPAGEGRGEGDSP